ncbi:Cupredoxin superfamily protein isoform 3 [Theobroma cacao]|uniref:Cupredoxin superfamily protein isoform 3 n=1 Tax=Theobroma cacao TaxID=3641 RepID=A0A061FIM5_THECC|nr:Cupredoxin superfamily protein isoform 3 [Theobroma cacao]
MKILSMLLFLISLLFPFFLASQSATILVDGVSEWENPSVNVGDSIMAPFSPWFLLLYFQQWLPQNMPRLSKAPHKSLSRAASRKCNHPFTRITSSSGSSTDFRWISCVIFPSISMAIPASPGGFTSTKR